MRRKLTALSVAVVVVLAATGAALEEDVGAMAAGHAGCDRAGYEITLTYGGVEADAQQSRGYSPAGYVTDMYDNVVDPRCMYRETLTDAQKSAYDDVVAGYEEGNEKFPVSGSLKSDEIAEVLRGVRDDHPEIFWLGTEYIYYTDSSGTVTSVKPSYSDLARDIGGSKATFERNAHPVVMFASKQPTDVAKVKVVHDWLTHNTVYDSGAPYNQFAYSTFVNHRTVCAGYATAFQYCMHKLGIPSAVLTGWAGEAHSWNLLYLDGDYYCMDVTWDDPTPDDPDRYLYGYFNVTDDQIGRDHTRDEHSDRLPRAYGTQYGYEAHFGDAPGSDFSGFDPAATAFPLAPTDPPAPTLEPEPTPVWTPEPTPIETPEPEPTPTETPDPTATPAMTPRPSPTRTAVSSPGPSSPEVTRGQLPRGARLFADSLLELGTLDDGSAVIVGSLEDDVWPREISDHVDISGNSLIGAVYVQDRDGNMCNPRLGCLRTGDRVVFTDQDMNDVAYVEVVMRGDVVGSGKMSLSQLARFAVAMRGEKPLDGAYLAAADITGSGQPMRLSNLVAMAAMLRAAYE